LREIENEPLAMRRARVRQHFNDNLEELRLVLDTKVDGFIASTHLLAGEAVYHEESLQLIYVSSRQAIDSGASVPGYAISNWAVLQLPEVLTINLGRNAKFVTAASILLPFIRTSMTDAYAENPKVFGRWQPRLLETHEAAEAFMQLLARPKDKIDQGMFELLVGGSVEETRWIGAKLHRFNISKARPSDHYPGCISVRFDPYYTILCAGSVHSDKHINMAVTGSTQSTSTQADVDRPRGGHHQY